MQKIKFSYRQVSNYSPKMISGVHGGLNAQGHIVMNCFHEMPMIPDFEIYGVKKDGQIGDLIKNNNTDSEYIVALRTIDTGIIMDVSTAKEIVKWLSARIDEFEIQITTQK